MNGERTSYGPGLGKSVQQSSAGQGNDGSTKAVGDNCTTKRPWRSFEWCPFEWRHFVINFSACRRRNID